MDTQNNNLPFKANEVISILQTAPDILARNEASVSACTNAGKTLLDTIEGNGGIGTDEIDTAVQEYLAKSKKTVENMNNRRKPLTQMLTAISKRFTTLEGSIDAKSKGTIPYLLQMERNKYAAKKLEEQKRREEEARQKQLVENEKAQYRADITVLLDTTYAAYVEKHINALNGIFNRASLATYGDVCRQITQTSTGFSWTDFVKNVVDNKQTFYMDGETRKAIKNEIAILKKKEYSDRYAFEIEASFSTVPLIAAIYVPLCMKLGISPLATVSIVGVAGALGDAGSPVSESVLGPTAGLNADGQHDHIYDSTIPTFIHYNIPLLIAGWIAGMVL